MEIPQMPHEETAPAEAPDAGPQPPPAARPVTHRPWGGPIVATLRHRWPEYLIEIFVIVFSISVSFGLDQWKERRREDEVERLYLKTLADNLASDIDALGEIVAATRGVIQRTRELLAASRSATPPPMARFNAAFSEMARRPSFFAHDAAFSDLRSSGNLRVIHDFKLKNALFDYYGEYESIKAKELTERESMITLIAPFVLKHIRLGSGFADATGSGREPASPPLPAPTLYNDPEFVNSLWLRMRDRGELLHDYSQELALAQRLRQRIARELR
jgi:hypothetical protein